MQRKEGKMHKLQNEKILNLTLHEIMEIVDNHPNIKVDLVDNLYYALLDNCSDNPNKIIEEGRLKNA